MVSAMGSGLGHGIASHSALCDAVGNAQRIAKRNAKRLARRIALGLCVALPLLSSPALHASEPSAKRSFASSAQTGGTGAASAPGALGGTGPLEFEPPGAGPLLSPPAPQQGPYDVPFTQIDSGNTAWMLTATALVLLMTLPGLALFYAGMVRKKNVLATAMHSLMACCVVSLLWIVAGYSLAFTPGSPWLGGFGRVLLDGLEYNQATHRLSVHPLAPNVPESVYLMFQMSFAIIAAALITGALAERMRFRALVAFVGLWSLLVYAPVAHWVWEPGGWLATRGMLDFAGGTVVHISAGAAALACAWRLGPREGLGHEPFFPFNLAYTLAGAGLLWVGWFGFNAGSAGAADGRAGMAMLATQTAAAAAALAWLLVEWLVSGRSTLLGGCSGAISGLVAVTPASGYVDAAGATCIGLVAGVLCYWGATGLKRALRADDALDVFGVHGIGGLVGAVLTGVFAQPRIGGATGQLGVQCLGALATLLYSGLASYALLMFIDALLGLRVHAEHEAVGLDISTHGERIP